MPEQMTTDVRAILDRDPFDADTIRDLREVLGKDPSRYKTLRDAASAMADREKGAMKPHHHLRLGVADVLLGKFATALEHLTKAGDQPTAQFFKGVALENLQRWTEASDAYHAAAKSGYDPKRAELQRVGTLRRSGKESEAKKLFATLDKYEGQHAEYHYQNACFLSDDGELAAAAAEFEKALSMDPDHTGALFHLAYINDLYGNDEQAIHYYQLCVRKPPVPMAALLNLGVLYEDENRFRDAESAYRQVLNFDPRQPRALLFFKDCRASRDMYYDEDLEKGYDKLRQLLEIPVTDFELSVRSRNCLRKMNIRTLGDLTRTTEAALLASKNFGETSLLEIKQMMTSKSVRLGMALEAGENRHNVGGRPEPMEELTQEERALLGKPISDLALSVRARKCMTKLGVSTVGDLISYTGDQLLECKNFGVTSLNEVKDKLHGLGIKLKGE